MQEFKTAIGRCVTQSPEKTYINGVLLGRALRRIEASHPEIRDLPGVVVAGGGLPARAKRWRGAEDSGPHQRLLGMGRPVPARYKEEIGQSVRHYVQRNRPQGWSVADAMSVLSRRGRGSVLRFQRGFCNEHEVFAESYGRAKNRANYWVQVRFEAAAATATHSGPCAALRPRASPRASRCGSPPPGHLCCPPGSAAAASCHSCCCRACGLAHVCCGRGRSGLQACQCLPQRVQGGHDVLQAMRHHDGALTCACTCACMHVCVSVHNHAPYIRRGSLLDTMICCLRPGLGTASC